MRLTPAGKFLLFLVGLGVLGYAGWTYRDRLPTRDGWHGPGACDIAGAAPAPATCRA